MATAPVGMQDPRTGMIAQDPRAAAIARLRQQLIAQEPGRNWTIKGIDRAQELAELMYDRTKGGLTDISSGITYNQGRAWTQADEDAAANAWQSGGGEAGNVGPWQGSGNTVGQVVKGHNPYVSIGGKDYGYINNGDSFLHSGENSTSNAGLGNQTQFAYSSRGDGGMRYLIQQGPDGKVRIVPQWTSSSDAKNVREAAIAAGSMLAAGYGIGSLAGTTGAGAGAGIGTGTAEGLGAGAGATGGSLAQTGTIAAESVGSMSSLPAMASNPSWMTQAAQGAGGLGAAAGGGGGTTAPGYSASANYGAGMSGAQTSTYDAVMRATGSPQLANMVTQGASGITQMWGQLTPAQRAQLGGSLGGLLATAASGGGSSANTAGQRTAGNMQLDVARQLQGLGTSEIAALGQRRASSDASFDQIIQAALRSQQTNDGRSQQLWDEMTTHYLPAGRRLAETAANYDTAGRREAAGAEAVAGVDAQLARQREGFGRDLRLSGGTMDAGRGATMDLAQRFAGAKLGAGADRVARQGVEDRGIALNQGVAQLGQGMGSMANSTSQIGLSAGGLATGAVQGRQGAYNAALTPALSALGGASSAAGGAGNTFNGVSNVQLAQQSQDNAGYAGLGSLIGGLGGLFLGGRP